MEISLHLPSLHLSPVRHRFLPEIQAAWWRTQGTRRRQKGLYDDDTMDCFQRAWQIYPSALNLFRMLLFQRDRGILLRPHQCGLIRGAQEPSKSLQTRIFGYALESGVEKELVYSCHTDLVQTYTQIYRQQLKNRQRFGDFLRKMSEHGICVVGNSNTLFTARSGAAIDEHGVVVRFNDYAVRVECTGKKTTILGLAPSRIKLSTREAAWIIVGAPNFLFRAADIWKNTPERLERLVTIPLELWRRLVRHLKHPPSLGLTCLALLREELGSWNSISATGFALTPRGHVNPNNKPSHRHNWPGEREIFQEWTRHLRVLRG